MPDWLTLDAALDHALDHALDLGDERARDAYLAGLAPAVRDAVRPLLDAAQTAAR